MKTYKLKELDIYIANVFSKTDAVFVARLNSIGVTEDDIEETDLNVNELHVISKVFRSYSALEPFLEK